jgi:hypothetical protein
MKKSLVITLLALFVVSMFAFACKKEEATTDTAATDTAMSATETTATVVTDTTMTSATTETTMTSTDTTMPQAAAQIRQYDSSSRATAPRYEFACVMISESPRPSTTSTSIAKTSVTSKPTSAS